MQQYLKELNEQQLKAVTTNAKKVLVMAGAGSGKTKVLTSKIKYKIDTGTFAQSICAFTFTNKAAREMKWRLEKMIGGELDAFIGTFHSYCYSFIMNFHYDLGFTSIPTVIDDDSKRKLIKQILDEKNIEKNARLFIDNISKIKNHVEAKGLSTEESILLLEVYDEYQKRLLQSNSLDFDDMIPMFIKLVNTNPIVYDISVASIQYVLVDECQDTNQIQYDLVNLLAKECGNIFMVGDENQIIYSFRSSDIKLFNDFKDSADEVIILNQNYRSTKQILKAANTLISNNTERTHIDLFSNIDSDIKIHYKEFNNTYEESQMVAKLIESLHKKGFNYKDIAVIYRNNYQSYLVENELNKLKIPYILYGGHPFYSYKEIKGILSIYKILLDPNNEIALNDIYNVPNPRCEAYVYSDMIKRYHMQTTDTLLEFLAKETNDNLRYLGIKLLTLSNQLKSMNNELFFMEILKHLGYDSYIKTTDKQDEKYSRIMTLKDIICNSDKSIIETINDLMISDEDDSKSDKVTLLTIHKSKGLEFQCVIIISCNEGIIPPSKITKEAKDEERRCMYVAMTRAMKFLYITCAQNHYIKGNKYQFNPSSFLIESGLFGESNLEYFRKYWYNK